MICIVLCWLSCLCFFRSPPAPDDLYTLSLHDALPIWGETARTPCRKGLPPLRTRWQCRRVRSGGSPDRKSTRLNSSHLGISYAVFCLKKKKHHSSRRHM